MRRGNGEHSTLCHLVDLPQVCHADLTRGRNYTSIDWSTRWSWLEGWGKMLSNKSTWLADEQSKLRPSVHKSFQYYTALYHRGNKKSPLRFTQRVIHRLGPRQCSQRLVKELTVESPSDLCVPWIVKELLPARMSIGCFAPNHDTYWWNET